MLRLSVSMKVLFVCLGNICRSPTAEGVFKKLAQKHSSVDFEIDSAGTSAWHEGEPPDSRSKECAFQRGYELVGQSRQVKDVDFSYYDLVVAMDQNNHKTLIQMSPSEHHHKIKLMTDYCKIHDSEKVAQGVPDPYSSGVEGFNLVLDIIEDASSNLIEILVLKENKQNQGS